MNHIITLLSYEFTAYELSCAVFSAICLSVFLIAFVSFLKGKCTEVKYYIDRNDSYDHNQFSD